MKALFLLQKGRHHSLVGCTAEWTRISNSRCISFWLEEKRALISWCKFPLGLFLLQSVLGKFLSLLACSISAEFAHFFDSIWTLDLFYEGSIDFKAWEERGISCQLLILWRVSTTEIKIRILPFIHRWNKLEEGWFLNR